MKMNKVQVDLSEVSIEKNKALRMYKQGYRFVGKHSAIKVCEWCKRSIKNEEFCYKQKFYGIHSNQCIQMSPAVFFCNFNCRHCWRSLNFTLPSNDFSWDPPEKIFYGCIEEFKKYLNGFFGSKKANKTKLKEAFEPKHFAISLSGEPTIYPYLPELINLIKEKGMTAFLVTNGTHPEMLKKLIKKAEPTNLYITLAAPDVETFKKECCPIIRDGWEKLNEGLELINRFSCNTVVRLTLSKKTNMIYPEKYSLLIEKSKPKYVEVKAYMAVGGARKKMGIDAMPTHKEIIEFAKAIEKNSKYKIINEKEDSRVVLMREG